MRPAGGAGAGARRPGWTRWVALAGVALFALQGVRAALVERTAETRPALAHALWPSHPAPTFALALGEIGAAAREGKAPPASALALIDEAGRHDPLAAEPLTVAATARLAAGDAAGAETLLKAALRRDPYAPAPHFLMADLLIRQERLGEALGHVGFLSRRIGSGAAGFADALVGYLRQPGALPRVAPVLGRDPGLREGVMTRLAQDPAATAPLAALVRPSDRAAPWLQNAVNVRLSAGNVAAARLLLARSGTQGGGQGLSAWGNPAAAGPLSWTLASGSDASVEAAQGGPLRIVYFGRADVPVAEHPLLLAPGRYRLSWTFAAAPSAGTFAWRVTCVGRPAPLAQAMAENASGTLELLVPADCPAQKLTLGAMVGDYQRTVSADLRAVAIARLGNPA